MISHQQHTTDRKMLTSRRIFAVGAVGLALTLASCGADDADALSADEFRSQANLICADGIDEIGAAVGSVFGDGEPTPELMQAALNTIVSTTRRQIDEIDAIDAPTSLENDVEALLVELRSATDIAESQGLGFWDDDGNPWERSIEMSAELGLDVCAES